jgi:hypothetical protein
MKRISGFLALLAAVASSHAQNNFIASLEPDPINAPADCSGIPSRAEFSLDGSSLKFTIRFGLESVIPKAAYLQGFTHLDFELGPPSIVIHSPGPWPDGFDGSTTFSGAFTISEELRTELEFGIVDVVLPGSAVGDFRGHILPDAVALPEVQAVERAGSSLRFHCLAKPLFEYSLEATASIDKPGWASVTNFVAQGQTAEVIFSDTVADATARFYRIRKQQIASGVLGQVFIYGCPAQTSEWQCWHHYATGLTIQAQNGELVSKLTTDTDGRFAQLLPPGCYLLVPDPGGIRRVESMTIRVWPKQLTTSTVVYDSGMR